jgi:hypothetical protein
MLEQIEFGLSDSVAAGEAADAAQGLLIPADVPLDSPQIASMADAAPDAMQEDDAPAGPPPLAS